MIDTPPPRVPDRSPDGHARTPRAPAGPPPCDRCGAACDVLHYDRAGEGELLCAACVLLLTIDGDHACSRADRKPIRLVRWRPTSFLETK